MAQSKLGQYKGRLTAAQIADGINAATSNARRLAEDAKQLLDAARFPTAASLAALAIEEAGKPAVLRQLALARDDKAVIEAWRDYRSHTRKNPMWVFLDLVADGARKLNDFAPIFDPNSDHPDVLDQLKQLGFYTDCLGKAHWSSPIAVIDQSLAQTLVRTATVLSSSAEAVTPREIELWIQHLGPVWNRHPSWRERALEKWYEALQAEGLRPGGENKMSQFIRMGVTSSKHSDANNDV
jgi:AbiV family abortive infection protein